MENWGPVDKLILTSIKNLFFLTGERLERIPDNDTLAYLLVFLDNIWFYDYNLIAVDGTGYLSFEKRHCPSGACL